MPAKSIAQQRFLAIAEHNPSKLRGKMPNMTHGQLHDFASTPTAGLPEHADGQDPAPNYGGAAPGAYDGVKGCHYDGKTQRCGCGQMKK
jgi:hypothetical protein